MTDELRFHSGVSIEGVRVGDAGSAITLDSQTDGQTDSQMDDLMAMFHTVTSRLDTSQRSLRDEVSHLRTELHNANEQLARSRRLTALGEMAAGIAHEIRNPLGSIGLDARMLSEDLESLPDQQQLAVRIRDSVRRLNAIVGDVLSFAHECHTRRTDVSADDLVARSIAMAMPGVESEGSVRIETSDGLDQFAMWCDVDRMEQAIVNVVRNAIEAMNENTQNRVGTDNAGDHHIFVDVCVRDGHDVIVIEDSGPGIPAGVRDRIFNPFFTTRHTGTGLGLAIVHRILDAHMGEIVIGTSSRLGGARVELVLPSKQAIEKTIEQRNSHANVGVQSQEKHGDRTNEMSATVCVPDGLVRQAS